MIEAEYRGYEEPEESEGRVCVDILSSVRFRQLLIR
jgi:hypothetical protein